MCYQCEIPRTFRKGRDSMNHRANTSKGSRIMNNTLTRGLMINVYRIGRYKRMSSDDIRQICKYYKMPSAKVTILKYTKDIKFISKTGKKLNPHSYKEILGKRIKISAKWIRYILTFNIKDSTDILQQIDQETEPP